MDIDKIHKHPNKNITLKEIKELYNILNHKELGSFINQCLIENVITPCKSSNKTYQVPQLYEKYHIIREKKNQDDILDELSFKLYHKLHINYYKAHIDEYLEVRELILKLSEYMKTNKNISIPFSINERSFDIFHNEKFLASATGQGLLSKLKIMYEDLGIYMTPEPFFYYLNSGTVCSNVLIIENKDTWYTMRNLLKLNKKILGMEFSAIIYGEGRKIQRTFADISYDEYSAFNSKENTFYYFGDIDSFGVSILHSLIKEHKEYKIIPYYTAYSILLSDLNNRRMKEEKDNFLLDMDSVMACFGAYPRDKCEVILNVCNNNEIFPQEILNNAILRRGDYE